ncbi:tetratricopeptide repeat protein [Alkalimarinus sediminis]|uniref:Tetratricopeptide repeat protein n=1 Tax=Alkalimarinus sediminis TaxID=1632866 RepID=A0A9E8HKV7_9ALTE|nr:tetratricopeptide repeat protein [Alkalimarinus sediminis]UZW76007.1 tetratricopeptide repeat protein [Alkalimarinus sediminis]
MIAIFNSKNLQKGIYAQPTINALFAWVAKPKFIKATVILLMSAVMSACSGVATKHSEIEHLAANQMDDSPKVVDEGSIQAYQQAVTLIDNGQYEEADKLLVSVIEKHPDLAAPLYNLGVISEAQNDLDSAIGFYNRAIAADNRYYLAYNNLGVIARTQGDFKQAFNYYRSGLNVAPDSAELHYNMAVLNEIYLHDYAKAIEHYERYLASFEEGGAEQPDKNVVSWIKDLKRRSR